MTKPRFPEANLAGSWKEVGQQQFHRESLTQDFSDSQMTKGAQRCRPSWNTKNPDDFKHWKVTGCATFFLTNDDSCQNGLLKMTCFSFIKLMKY